MDEKKKMHQNLTGSRKAAVFLLSIGEEYASKVFNKMSETEIKKVADEMSQIDQVNPEDLAMVSEEFLTKFEGEGRLVVEGQNFLKNVIDKSMDKGKAKTLFMEIEEKKNNLPFAWSRNIDAKTLAGYLENEHPQTTAMILAHIPSETASEILMAISEDKKGDIALRVAQLGQVPDEIVKTVDDALRSELKGIGRVGSIKSDGLQVLVDILNGVDRATEDIIMESIEEENVDMAGNIREMMFIFEDLIAVDDRGMREILKNIESSQLTLALKTASDEMKEKILNNLSSRAAEMLKEDLEVMGPVRLSEVEEAQQGIVRAAKVLADEGTIVLAGKGKEDILV